MRSMIASVVQIIEAEVGALLESFFDGCPSGNFVICLAEGGLRTQWNHELQRQLCDLGQEVASVQIEVIVVSQADLS